MELIPGRVDALIIITIIITIIIIVIYYAKNFTVLSSILLDNQGSTFRVLIIITANIVVVQTNVFFSPCVGQIKQFRPWVSESLSNIYRHILNTKGEQRNIFTQNTSRLRLISSS